MRQPITKFTTFVAKTMLKRSSFTFNQGVLQRGKTRFVE